MNIPQHNLAVAINDLLGIELQENISGDQLKGILAEYINELIGHNFSKLVNLLYRIDVNETKLRQLLNENAMQDAGRIIAELIIERQLQKIAYRERFQSSDKNEIDENEKW